MNSGIKLSTFAVAGLLSVGASALTFDESAAPGGDFNAAMGIEESVGTLNLGTNTITGSLLSTDMGGAGETDPFEFTVADGCLLYTSPSPRDRTRSRMPSSA